ncbi:DUF1292 domain-containing protein [Metabacillus bambusae]|uniref:DUF1292 domain-containing protein n=1 Tax=Metabacillus bambusae TaxID=2795218 RepID=A0ABS3N679_9BACI|nr:DUF1292 domain-containing protein [Metabacillus bambusae]MBO1513673.1 DUF1292 domain-containing protein [Metabacillus bambusae]
MSHDYIRDWITVEDDDGNKKQFVVEALLAMEENTYALLRSEHELDHAIVMQVENEDDEQYLIGINDPLKKTMVLDAYEIAVEANPAD